MFGDFLYDNDTDWGIVRTLNCGALYVNGTL